MVGDIHDKAHRPSRFSLSAPFSGTTPYQTIRELCAYLLSAFAQGAGQDPDALVKKYQNALERGGACFRPVHRKRVSGQSGHPENIRVSGLY